MFRFPCKALLLGALLLGVSPAMARQACSVERQEQLLTRVLVNETADTPYCRGTILQVINNRLGQEKWGGSLCGVLAKPNQFDLHYRRGKNARWVAAAREEAQRQVTAYNASGRLMVDARAASAVGHRDSFHAGGGRSLCGNLFYASADRRRFRRR